MRLLIDANILLDVLQKREPFFKDSSLIWKLCETDQHEGFVSVLSIANLMYVMRRDLDSNRIADILSAMRLIFRFEDLTVQDLLKAAEMKWDDFEDAVQAATAERIAADVIITRNVRDFKNSKTIAFTPAEFLARQ